MPATVPPSFYDNVAAMGGGAGAPPPKTPGAAPGGKNPELMDAFGGIFRVMKKMVKIEPELGTRFEPIYQALGRTISDVLKVDPSTVMKEGEEEKPAEKPPETVETNKSPQEAEPAPQGNKSPQDVPVPA